MTSKTAYQFDRAGMYTGTTEADESPLEPGVYHLPSYCTLKAPPDEWPDDKWPRWNGAQWLLKTRPRTTKNAEEIDPVIKLRQFLEANPDVAGFISNTSE